ncbi:YpoC family protein [Bacillus sp. CECT 9360]|uniref:YpoC family protein n=1 Tax=Bacillus sp. CECT 9360 TaxID=2845821 RepID=UPI001E4E74F9|nr:hypothetical protein [Bacillus sp. CECT 9360]CAH0345509.1 hypothetical protein BCI9360_01796 [Bacillus sp. CECT 9360]
MSGFITCKIPMEMKSSLFFSADEAKLSSVLLKEWTITRGAPFFPYELLYWNDLDGYRPWEDPGKPIEELLCQWEAIQAEAGGLFAERKAQEAEELMKEGLSIYLSILFWMHNGPVGLRDWKDKLEEFSYKPVNSEERLSFIFSRPALYHSFVQLSQLFTELKKLYSKMKIISKKTSKH